MGLETGTWISDLTTTNPASGDAINQGDDHLRLIKTVLKNTFPTATKAFYHPSSAAKTTNYTVLSSDMNSILTMDTSAGTRSFTLPSLTANDKGWSCTLVKIASANSLTIVGTVNGAVNPALTTQYASATVMWTGTAWLAQYSFFPLTSGLTLPDLTVTGALAAGTFSAGASTISSTLGVTGNFSVNTNKFTVNATSGDAAVAGVLTVTGNAALSTASLTGALTVPEISSPASPSVGSVKIYAKSDKLPYAKNSNGDELPLVVFRNMIMVRDEKTSGTAGGSATSGSWGTRTLNTQVVNNISGASLAANQVTLPAGTYYAKWSVPFFRTNLSQSRLYNVSDVAAIGYGSNTAEDVNVGGDQSVGEYYFTLAASKTLEVQYRVGTSWATDGLGRAMSFGNVEVYTQLTIWKIG